MQVDAHFHVWDLEANSYPWLQQGKPIVRVYGDSAPLRTSYRIADYRADAEPCGIKGGIYVQCGMEDPVEEARYVQRLADEAGDDFPIYTVAYADMTRADAGETLARLADVPNVRGVRFSVAWDSDPAATFAPTPVPLDGENLARNFRALGELGLVFDCMLYPAQMHELAELCERHPSTAVVVNHTGLPLELHDPGLERWRAGMRRLAEVPQVAVKISGLGMVRRDWTSEGAAWAAAVIRETVETFGTDRCMFASNYPVERLASSYEATYGVYRRAVAHLPDGDRARLFGDNARRIYRMQRG